MSSGAKRMKRQTQQVESERVVRASAGKRLPMIVAGILLLGLIGFAGIHYFSASTTEPANSATGPVATAKAEKSSQPKTLGELLAVKPESLATVDIGVMNMLCAEGLPGAEEMKVADYQVTLDQWAEHVKSETARNFHRFREDPANFYNSEAFYKMLMMAVVVYEDFGIRYNPKWIAPPSETRADDHFFADSRDIFIHGMVGPQHMGTCSSMPVFYIALGRRLGYPLQACSHQTAPLHALGHASGEI